LVENHGPSFLPGHTKQPVGAGLNPLSGKFDDGIKRDFGGRIRPRAPNTAVGLQLPKYFSALHTWTGINDFEISETDLLANDASRARSGEINTICLGPREGRKQTDPEGQPDGKGRFHVEGENGRHRHEGDVPQA